MIQSIDIPLTTDTEAKLVVWSKEIARAVTGYAHDIKAGKTILSSGDQQNHQHRCGAMCGPSAIVTR
jgi:hypothetical protein